MARINAVLALSSLNGTNGFRLAGVTAGDFAGYSVSAAGDVNGDGFDDVIVGAPDADPGGQSSAGSSYVVFGRSGGFGPSLNLSALNGSNGFRIDGVSAGDRNGRSVSSAGDINGDGFEDIIVGAFTAKPGGRTQAGSSYVVFGRSGGFGSALNLANLNGTNGFRLDGLAAQDYNGVSVSSAGDVNGDGFADILVGASGADSNGRSSPGSTYVVFGRSGGFGATVNLAALNGTNGFRIDGASAGDYSGLSVSSAGDVNGDGLDDILVCADASPSGQSAAGSSYVVFGRRSGFGSSLNLGGLNGTNGFRIDGAAAGDRSGRPVFSAGDVNGDGFDDIVIGASGADPGGRTNAGSSYVIFGRSGGFAPVLTLADLTSDRGFRIDSPYSGDGSSLSVSSAGDVNGDGFGDVIVGLPFADRNGRTDSGASYVVYGRPGGFGSSLNLSSLNGRNGFRIDGVFAGDQSGRSVHGAGDVNGDGFGDLIVGANGTFQNGTNSGSSYVIYGAPSRVAAEDFNHDLTSDLLLQNGGTVADWILGNGAYQSGNTLTTGATGYTVVGRGDVNRDGTADIILQSGGTVVDWIMAGGRYQAGNVLANAGGYVVRAVADVDGDGTADLVLQQGDSVVAWSIRNGAYAGGRVLANASGFTVVGAGDFDGDGTSDLLLQAGTGTVVQWRLQNGAYAGGGVLANGNGFGVVGTGDVNGDGTDDVVLQAGGTVVDWILGNGAYRSGNTITSGAGGFSVRAVGDYNGDGTDDLALQAGTGTVVQWSLRNGLYAGGGVLANGNGFTVV